MSQPLFFKIYKNNKLKGVKQFSLEQVSIGSSPDVDIILDSAAPWHTLIEKKGESYFISDLGGEGGTLLNGKKAVENQLSPGDRIQIGDFLIEFFIGVPFVKGSAEKKPAPPKTSPKAEVEAEVPEETSPQTSEKPVEEQAKEKVSSVKKAPVKKTAKAPVKEEEKKLKPKKVSEKKLSEAPQEIAFQEAAPQKEEVAPVEKPSIPEEEEKMTEPPPQKKTDLSSFVDEGADIVRKSFRSNPWKNFLPSKPAKKTFAPPSFVKDLDKAIPPGKGGVVEVLVAWGDRIVSVYHSKKNETITIGNHPKASIKVPNLVSKEPYPLVHSGQIAQVNLLSTMPGKIIRENKSIDFETAFSKGVMTQEAGGKRRLSLGQNELIRVDFHSNLKIYIRYTSLSSKASKAVLFDFNETELVGLGLAFCFMLALFFFVGIYYPRYLVDEEKMEEKTIRIARIQFKPPPKKVLKMTKKKKKIQKKVNIPMASKKKVRPKKPPSIKKKGKAGKIGAVAAKPQKKKKIRKKTVTSARPGGNRIKSKKPGAGARSPKPDPTQIGLLGTFGKKGIQQQLDKVYSGAGELGGLADKATGRSGSKVYSGEGIGTKFKDPGAGGKGSNLIGISGISTKGRGGGVKGFGRGGGLGVRGSVNLSFGSSEIDVEGSIDKEAIRRVVRSNQSQLERCHSMVLQNNPSIQGRIRVQWTIENSRVTNVVIKSNDSGSRKLANCLASRLKNWRFIGAVPKGGVGNVTFPFVFTGS